MRENVVQTNVYARALLALVGYIIEPDDFLPGFKAFHCFIGSGSKGESGMGVCFARAADEIVGCVTVEGRPVDLDGDILGGVSSLRTGTSLVGVLIVTELKVLIGPTFSSCEGGLREAIELDRPLEPKRSASVRSWLRETVDDAREHRAED